jgi:hypothetical protein
MRVCIRPIFLPGNWLIKPDNIMKKKMKILGMTAAILTFVIMTPAAVVADDLLPAPSGI